MKKALFIAYYYPPSGEVGIYRTLKFNKYLPDFGWQSHVLTPSNGKYAIYNPSLLKLIPDRTVVHRCFSNECLNRGLNENHAVYYSKNPLTKILQRFTYGIHILLSVPDTKRVWNPFALRSASRIIREEDISAVIISAPPFSSFLVGSSLKRALPDVRIFIDYRDPWTSNIELIPFTALHRRIHLKQERYVLSHVDGVICNTPANMERLLDCYPWLPEEKVTVITNGYDEEDFAGIRGVERAAGKYTISHLGHFYQHFYRGDGDIRRHRYRFPGLKYYCERKERMDEIMQYFSPVNFLKAVGMFLEENAEAREKLRVKFIGEPGTGYEHLAAELNLGENVSFLRDLSYEDNLREMASSDALLFTLSSGEESGSWVPSKLYQYLAAGRPVLCLVPPGDAREFATRAGVGVFADQKDVLAIINAIASLYAQDAAGGQPGTPNWDFIRKFERRYLTGRLADFMDARTRS